MLLAFFTFLLPTTRLTISLTPRTTCIPYMTSKEDNIENATWSLSREQLFHELSTQYFTDLIRLVFWAILQVTDIDYLKKAAYSLFVPWGNLQPDEIFFRDALWIWKQSLIQALKKDSHYQAFKTTLSQLRHGCNLDGEMSTRFV
jgi:hypothetical protein